MNKKILLLGALTLCIKKTSLTMDWQFKWIKDKCELINIKELKAGYNQPYTRPREATYKQSKVASESPNKKSQNLKATITASTSIKKNKKRITASKEKIPLLFYLNYKKKRRSPSQY